MGKICKNPQTSSYVIVMKKIETSDLEIRKALHAKYLRRANSRPNTLIIDELGLVHAKSRIDIAVINGHIHGYEIKSEKDNLDRLDIQISTYTKSLQKITFVASKKHLEDIISVVPEWCGLILAERGIRGGINFSVLRTATINPLVDPFMMAHLLWRDEVVDLLKQAGYSAKDLRQPRKQLYEILCRVMTPKELTASIRSFMVQRRTWRDR